MAASPNLTAHLAELRRRKIELEYYIYTWRPQSRLNGPNREVNAYRALQRQPLVRELKSVQEEIARLTGREHPPFVFTTKWFVFSSVAVIWLTCCVLYDAGLMR